MFDVGDLLSVGQNHMIKKVVQRSDTAAAYSKDLNRFLSTPSIIDMAIRSSMETVDRYLPDDFVSVGFSIEFTHTASTSLGMTVVIKTTIINIHGNEIDLRIDAWDEQGEIGHGTHKRSVVSKEHLYQVAERRVRFLANRRLNESKRGELS